MTEGRRILSATTDTDWADAWP